MGGFTKIKFRLSVPILCLLQSSAIPGITQYQHRFSKFTSGSCLSLVNNSTLFDETLKFDDAKRKMALPLSYADYSLVPHQDVAVRLKVNLDHRWPYIS